MLWNSKHAGKIANQKAGNYHYIRITKDGVKFWFYEHRIIWALMTGEWPKEIDHINGNGWDNRWKNLRNGTHVENLQNRTEFNKSGFRGVVRYGRKWQARIQFRPMGGTK
jgi:hypothetical protein